MLMLTHVLNVGYSRQQGARPNPHLRRRQRSPQRVCATLHTGHSTLAFAPRNSGGGRAGRAASSASARRYLNMQAALCLQPRRAPASAAATAAQLAARPCGKQLYGLVGNPRPTLAPCTCGGGGGSAASSASVSASSLSSERVASLSTYSSTSGHAAAASSGTSLPQHSPHTWRGSDRLLVRLSVLCQRSMRLAASYRCLERKGNEGMHFSASGMPPAPALEHLCRSTRRSPGAAK